MEVEPDRMPSACLQTAVSGDTRVSAWASTIGPWTPTPASRNPFQWHLHGAAPSTTTKTGTRVDVLLVGGLDVPVRAATLRQ